MSSSTPRRVAYFYDSDVGNYFYGQGHMMKPHRIRMAHNLLMNYGLFKKMNIYRPPRCGALEMTRFHSDEYINFLRTVTPETVNDFSSQLPRFNVGEDCPVFDGIFQFCQISAGGSIAGAAKLNNGDADVAINWAGGLHHAKKTEASGFCYVNDINLGILELLKQHPRVLYIDIDVHHGDGVEEAFYTTDRVMTVSFHKFGEFFPGTGEIRDIGAGKGKHYAVNFPLKDGIDDETYHSVFKPVIGKVMEWYRPGAVVLQCGADSLSGDRLGCFNLSLKGHSECVSYVKSFNVPMLVLGGGGYTIRNVARAWTYETALLLDAEVSDELPFHDYIDYYGPEYRLHVPSSNMENLNTREYLEKCRNRIIDNLRHVAGAPSAQLGTEIPPDVIHSDNEDEDEHDPDLRPGRGGRRHADNELSDSDDEDERRGERDGGDGEEISRSRRAAAQREHSAEEDEEVEIEENHAAPPSGDNNTAAPSAPTNPPAPTAAPVENKDAMDTK